LPGTDLYAALQTAKAQNGKQAAHTLLATLLPRRLAKHIAEAQGCTGNLADLSQARLRRLSDAVNDWRITPGGTEGYRTAEVTAGGVDTRDLDSSTMEARSVPGLYFIGEVVDVTGWLGGYNFQWAWSSGWCAGQAV
jgi:predicted Rossmann fold flavoprotein